MGYTTDFSGEFSCNPPLSKEHREYLSKFNETRRMKRRAAITNQLPDEVRLAVGLPVGPEGAYFVGGGGSYGQDRDGSIEDYNEPPEGQPGLWCQWCPSDSGEAIHWDGGEKFYNYVEWIEYLVEHFLKPWGYKLNGSVRWSGEEMGDTGVISVRNNVINAQSTQDEQEELSNRVAVLEKALRKVMNLSHEGDRIYRVAEEALK